MKLGIDVDGVLANFNAGFRKVLQRVAPAHVWHAPEHFEPQCWDWPQQCGYTRAEVGAAWSEVHNDSEFWRSLAPLPGAEHFLKGLPSGREADIYFVTHREGFYAKRQTEYWLARYGVTNPTVLLAAHKGTAAKALRLDAYIDDKPENVLDVQQESPATRVCLLTQPWNAEYVLLFLEQRVGSLQEFRERVKF